MKTLGFGRHVLGIAAAAALLAGCGGSQPPIGAPGVMSQSTQFRHTGTDMCCIASAAETAVNLTQV